VIYISSSILKYHIYLPLQLSLLVICGVQDY